jgi:glycosyltransferase involved in cell wall biosynthesis
LNQPLPLSGRNLRIVIPAHNEEMRIAATLEEFCSHFGDSAAIIVVANGCSDRTVEIVGRFKAKFGNLDLIEVPWPIGKGGAVRVGLMSGDEPFVAYADADGSTSAAQIRSLQQICEVTRFAGVIGSRWLYGSVINKSQPPIRRLASRTFNCLVRLLFALPYSDTQCGAKVFRRSAIASVLTRLELANFAFDIDLLYVMKISQLKVVESPIVWQDSDFGTTVNVVRSSLTMLLSILRLRVRHSHMRSLPFVDMLARSCVIPVRNSYTLLAISGDRYAPQEHNVPTVLNDIAKTYESAGHLVKWAQAGTLGQRVKLLVWYIGRGHREVDFIASDASDVIANVVRLSSKPKKIIGSRRRAIGSAKFEELGITIADKLLASASSKIRFVSGESGWDLLHGSLGLSQALYTSPREEKTLKESEAASV